MGCPHPHSRLSRGMPLSHCRNARPLGNAGPSEPGIFQLCQWERPRKGSQGHMQAAHPALGAGLTQQVDLLPCPVSPSELQATLPQCQPAFSSQSPLWPHTACLPRGPCSPGGQGPGIPTEEGPRATQGGLGARPSPVRLPRCSAVPEASGGTKASGAARSSSLEPPLSMSQPQVFWLKGGLWADVGGTHSTKVGHWATASHGYCS